MVRAYSIDVRERVLAAVLNEGIWARGAAARFGISESSAIKWVKRHQRTGTVNPRTSYSLRHTYICFRLMEGADIYQIAKNCRTSVEMIEKYYASHIKNMLDASAINVRRAK